MMPARELPAPFSTLFVCTANICRSPMAAALLSNRLLARAARPRVESAGIAALVGAPADPEAVALLAELGIDLGGHAARQLTPRMAADFDLILVMEERQQRELERLIPVVRGRVHLLGRFGGFEVDDPFGGDRSAFRRSLALIQRGLDDFDAAAWRRA